MEEDYNERENGLLNRSSLGAGAARAQTVRSIRGPGECAESTDTATNSIRAQTEQRVDRQRAINAKLVQALARASGGGIEKRSQSDAADRPRSSGILPATAEALTDLYNEQEQTFSLLEHLEQII